MNLTLIMVCFIVMVSTIHGYKKGMTKEVAGLISWTVTLFIMSLVIMLYTSFNANKNRNIIFTIILLMIVLVIYSVIRFLLQPIKLVVKLPVFKFIDRILGLVIGIVEGMLIVWLVYVLNESGIFGQFGEMIMADTGRSKILSCIYEYNYLIKIATGF